MAIMDFKCPVCGSSFFRTTSVLTEPVWTRECRGHFTGRGKNYTGCTFTWLSTDDSKYGLGAPDEPMCSGDNTVACHSPDDHE